MSNLVTWLPGSDSSVVSYDLARGPAVSGPWTPLATIARTIPGADYDSGLGRFVYTDAAGTATDYYRLVANTATSSSTPSVFQVGASSESSPTTEWTSAALLESIKRRANLPTSQVTLTDADLLTMASEELHSTLTPLLMSANEDYFLAPLDLPISSSGTYRIPRRAVGSKLHSVAALDTEGEEVPVARVPADSLVRLGFYVRGGYVVLINRDGLTFTGLRLRFYLRPARLVDEGEVAYVTAVDGVTGALTLNVVPSCLSAAAPVDVLKGGPPFDTLLADAHGTVVGMTVTFAAPVDGVEVGDIVAPAGRANVVQLPVEWFPVLAQAVAAKALEELGYGDEAVAAYVKLKEAKDTALGLVSTRVDNNVEVVQPVGLWR
jgi:hypothetical protein